MSIFPSKIGINNFHTYSLYKNETVTAAFQNEIFTKGYEYVYLYVTYIDHSFVSGQQNNMSVAKTKISSNTPRIAVYDCQDRYYKKTTTPPPDKGVTYIYRVDCQNLSSFWLYFNIRYSTNIKVELFYTNENKESSIPSIEPHNDKNLMFETKDVIARRCDLDSIIDAWNGVIITTASGTVLEFSEGYPLLENTSKYTVDTTTFSNSTISQAWIVPFDTGNADTSYNYRIFLKMANDTHYCSGSTLATRTVFGESALWDIANGNKRFPTKTKTNETASPTLYTYNPVLPDARYVLPSTAVFPLQQTINGIRFNRYVGRPVFNFIHQMLCRTEKAVYFGSYENNRMDARVGVWMTTDGGKNWYLKYDFLGYTGLYGNIVDEFVINMNTLPAYTPNSLSFRIIQPNNPTNENKEPATKYIVSEPIVVSNITNTAKCVVTSAIPSTVNISLIAFQENSTSGDYSFLANPDLTVDNLGTKIYWAVRKSSTEFYLYEYHQSLDSSLSTKHVHAVNETQDGILVNVGEQYPNGWILYAIQRNKDRGALVYAHDPMQFIRLNSGAESIQRACGSYMYGGKDPIFIFGSDESLIPGQSFTIPGRNTAIERTSTGLWRGRVSDIDDFSKWECIADIPEPCIYMYKLGKMIICGFQLGGFAISTDEGNTWEYRRFYNMPTIYGVINNRIILSDNRNRGYYVIAYK